MGKGKDRRGESRGLQGKGREGKGRREVVDCKGRKGKERYVKGCWGEKGKKGEEQRDREAVREG